MENRYIGNPESATRFFCKIVKAECSIVFHYKTRCFYPLEGNGKIFKDKGKIFKSQTCAMKYDLKKKLKLIMAFLFLQFLMS